MRKYMLPLIVVTAVAGAAHAQTLTPTEIERELLKNRLFATMREVDREGYDFALSLLTGTGTTDPRGVLTAKAQFVVQSRIFEWILRGTDAAVVDYHRALIARLDAVSRISASECHNLATGKPISPETLGVPAVAKADAAGADHLIALLESTRGRARIELRERMTESDAERLVSLWAAVATTPRDTAIFDGATLEPGEHARSCALHTALYRRMIALPVADAAGVLRAWTVVLH